MNSFQCNQRQSFKMKLPHNMGCCQPSRTNCVVSLAMSQVVPLPLQSVATLSAFTKTQFQSAPLLSQHSLRRDRSYREVGHTAVFTLLRYSMQILKAKWSSLSQWCSGGWRLPVLTRAPQNGYILAACVCVHVWGKGTACSHTPASSWGLGCDDLSTIEFHTFVPFYPEQTFWNETQIIFSLFACYSKDMAPRSPNTPDFLFIQITDDSNCRADPILSYNVEHTVLLFPNVEV